MLDCDCTELDQMEKTRKEVAALSPELRPALKKFLDTGAYDPEYGVCDYTVEEIMKLQPDYGVICTFLMFDLFIKDYERARNIVWTIPTYPFGIPPRRRRPN